MYYVALCKEAVLRSDSDVFQTASGSCSGASITMTVQDTN
jgi:hypothetical protein